MSKQSIVFKKLENTTLAIRLTKERINDRSVGFEIVSATDSVDFPQLLFNDVDPNSFNIIGPNGEVVKEFEEGLFICTGRIIPSNQPRDLLNNKGLTYNVQFEESVLLNSSQFEDICYLLGTYIIDLGFSMLNNLELEEYEYKIG